MTGWIITAKGKEALENGVMEDGTPLTPQDRLIIEIVARAPNISKENAVRLTGQAVEIFGDAERALEALKDGAFEIAKTGSVH